MNRGWIGVVTMCRSSPRLQLWRKVSINSFWDLCTGQYGEWYVSDFHVDFTDKWLESMLTRLHVEMLF
jgi:hypothetical protein